VPTPFYVGPVNVYLVRNDPITLIDVGPNTDEAFQALRDGVEALGLRLDAIKRIVISHAHEDHYGQAARIQQISGCQLLIHSWEINKVQGSNDATQHRKLLERAGVPVEALERFEKGYTRFAPLESRAAFDPLEDEDEIIFENGSLRVLHTPGHTPGSICLMRESNRELLAADTVIRHITPNPMLSCDPFDEQRRFPSLNEYLCSVARIKELAPTLVHTGHGHHIDDYGEHFHTLIKHTDERQAKLLKLLPKHGATAWEMAELLFPTTTGLHRYLAVSESQAHLDMAVADGKAKIEQRGDAELFRRALD
jgi:glyoxylase-like metal-dependent hydrolase (beta-lactamase superfamily II)